MILTGEDRPAVLQEELPTDLSTMQVLGQLMFSLSDDAQLTLYGKVEGSMNMVDIMILYAQNFELEWRKMTPVEHDEAGDDFIDEIDKLAHWLAENPDKFVAYEPYRGYVPKIKYAVEIDEQVNGKPYSKDSVDVARSRQYAIEEMKKIAFDRARSELEKAFSDISGKASKIFGIQFGMPGNGADAICLSFKHDGTPVDVTYCVKRMVIKEDE